MSLSSGLQWLGDSGGGGGGKHASPSQEVSGQSSHSQQCSPIQTLEIVVGQFSPVQGN